MTAHNSPDVTPTEQHLNARSRTSWWLRLTRRYWCHDCERRAFRRHRHDNLDVVLAREWRT